ncbi:MAG: glycosyltransferase [Candidatus Thorarchaeota archaeon]
MSSTVIIPTLNERENIELLIRAIYAELGDNVSVVVVDDDSQDGTQEIVQTLTHEFPSLRLIVRRGERGLGSAVRLAAETIEDGPVVVMDADFSHHPRFIPRMLERIDHGFDIVVGSRYVQGGRVVGWSSARIAVSRVATLIARVLLRVPLKDPMSGFVATRNPEILVRNIKHADYKFLLEVVTREPHLRVAEIPIVFSDRERGKSKLGGRTLMLYLLLVLRLLFETGWRRG